MPLYEYECSKCHTRFERIERVEGPHLKKCPSCGGKVERLIAPPAIQFKGSGWYVTDYARKASGGDSSKDEKADTKDTKETKGSEESASTKETKKRPAHKDK